MQCVLCCCFGNTRDGGVEKLSISTLKHHWSNLWVAHGQNMLHVQAEHTLKVSETLTVACIIPRPGVRLEVWTTAWTMHTKQICCWFIGTFRSSYMFTSWPTCIQRGGIRVFCWTMHFLESRFIQWAKKTKKLLRAAWTLIWFIVNVKHWLVEL